MLSVERLQAHYGASQALFGVNLQVNAGEVVTLMGRNGMGKTTSINCIMGIIPTSNGQITWEDRVITNRPSYHIAQSGIGLVPEGRQIFPNLSVLENLIVAARAGPSDNDPWDSTRVLQMFPALAARRHGLGNLLSGGEQQMLAIGRALMTNPRLLILDEATEGLAPLVRQEIWSCLSRLKGDGLSILVIDKNVADLARIADRHFIIEKGETVWSGRSETLLASEDIKRRYLGI
jgi:branched-chain amino acid transport system ATP-binding protein